MKVTAMFVLALFLVGCGPAQAPAAPCAVNDVTCHEGQYFQCVCALRTCRPGPALEGEWKRLGDGCVI